MSIEQMLAMVDICDSKKEYMNAFANIAGKNVSDMADILGFFESPASTQHHGVFPGGLVKHSINVLHNCILLMNAFDLPQKHQLTDTQNEKWEQDLFVACLFHDLCKAGMYEETTRNVKVGGVWKQEPYFKVKDNNTGFGHGAESLYRLEQAGFKFNLKAWAMAVYWHMGNFGLDYTTSIQYRNAIKQHPEILMLHTADMMASAIQGL